jgi:4-hydroxy-2-oxoheptanedioate aldolase
MRSNTAKRALERGETVFGYAMSLGSPAACEAMASTGIDFLLLDMQHGGWGPESITHGLMAASLGTAIPMARVATNDYMQIGKLLDEGAMGIVVPLVNTPEQAKAAADACRFPPVGTRSHGWNGAGRYGADYFPAANDEILLAVQLESVQAVRDAEAIMSTPGVDACWVGPADLALSLGIDPRTMRQDDRFLRLLEDVVTACNNVGKAPGLAMFAPEDGAWAASLGFRYNTAGWDGGFLRGGAVAGLDVFRKR